MESVSMQEEGDYNFFFNGNKYYIDGMLKSNLDIVAIRDFNKWDNLIIIDGLERSGKTTIGSTACAYLSTRLNRSFSVDSIYFDIDSLIEYAQTSREKIILWDESALGGLGSQWNTREQLKLKQLLITCGKYRHVLVFIIPDFTLLSSYFAVHRSICLLRTYTPNMVERGFFKFYGAYEKKLLYYTEKKKIFDARIQPNFKGVFRPADGLYDVEAYEKKKDEAIQRIGKSKEGAEAEPDRANFRLKAYRLMDYFHYVYKVPYKEMASYFDSTANIISVEMAKYRKAGLIPPAPYKKGKFSTSENLSYKIDSESDFNDID